ncbi:triple tyrosine motif-containing protein [Dyadobacter sandarakinus]|uniref:triple tyrosine motif-containing protein n=1 Tax=Dyadobacter sandarakinus TaxID=2747268 RepID=UPI001E585BA2|nr:triple tyrosine motif-containing protein [Dyadobacter sandarakinus]
MTLLIAGITFFPVKAQEIPPLINYPASAYKAHNQNWSIDEGNDHLVYAANSDGLLEYDGGTWKLYQLPDRQIVRTILFDQVSIASVPSRVVNMPARKEYRIYAGGFGEFGYWRKAPEGQLQYVSLSRNAGFASLKTEEIWHIIKTSRYIYFQSFSRIYRYDGKHLTEINPHNNFMFLQEVNQRVLVPVIGKSLYELKGEHLVPVAGTEPLAQSIVSSILPFPGGRMLISTTKNGLFIWDNNRLEPWNIAISDELKRNMINRAILLGDGSYAFGTIQKGVYIVSPEGKLLHQFNKKNGLQNNTILALSEDNRRQLWIGMDQGIDLAQLSAPIVSYRINDNPLGSTYAAALWKGQLYVGTNKGVFVKKWLSDEAFRPVPGLGGQTWTLTVVNNQLLCGHNDATYRITDQGVVKLSDVTGGWVMLPVTSGADTLLLQGSYTGLHVYRKDAAGNWSYAHRVKGIPAVPIKQIVQDAKGQFWLGHAYKGLFVARLTPALDTALTLKEFKSPEDIPSEFSIEIQKWRNHIVVRSGTAFFEPDAQNVLQPARDFTKHDDSFKLRSGINGEWFKVYMNRVSFINAQNTSRMLELMLVRNDETIIPLSPDYYFFCLDNGYALFNRRMTGLSQPADEPPLIRKVTNLRNVSESFAVFGSPRLPADARSVRIAYALPVYGKNIQYQYRLQGLTDQWSEWTDQNFAEFTNLEAGDYTFEVRSSLSEVATSYKFGIQPYWRETVMAKLLLAVGILLMLAGLVVFQEKRAARHRQRLIREQEEELSQQRLQSERQIMEIQNEKLQTEVQSKSQQLSNVAINVVRKNEILEEIRDELKQVKAEMGNQLPNIHYQKLLNSIERNVAGRDDWVLFEQNFDEVHEQFFKRLRSIYPSISPSELRLAACLRMNLSTKEMAPVLGISVRGVEIKRYRLRKKLGLDADSNLVQFMMDI